MTYNLITDVTGETATSNSLISFDLKAGTLAEDTPQEVFMALLNAGYLAEEVTPVAKVKKTLLVETPVSDIQKEK